MFQINNRLYNYQRSAAAIRILTALALASLIVFVYSVDDLHAQQTSATDRTVAFKPCLFSRVAKVEPDAGTWKTWVLQSPDQVRIGAPPYVPDDIAELRRFELARSDSTLDQVLFWDSGGPSYRWNEIALNETVRAGLNNVRYSRVMALVNVALYDAIIAAWESKYLHRRPRPVE